MRANQMTKVLVALVAGLVAVALPTQAQQDQQGGGQRRGSGDRIERQLEQMGTQLKLTDAQKKQLRPILEEQSKKMREVFQDENLSQEQRREKMGKLREQTDAQIKKVLTTEQYESWQKMLQERRRQRGDGQGQGGGQRQRNNQ